MIKVYLKGVLVDANVDFEAIGDMTSGWSGSDLKGLCREAAMSPLRRYLSGFTDRGDEGYADLKRLNDEGYVKEGDVGGITHVDFLDALTGEGRIRGSVDPGVAEKCLAWNEEYGSC